MQKSAAIKFGVIILNLVIWQFSVGAVVTNRPPPFLDSNADYSISACSSNFMVQITATNVFNAGDDDLVWSHSGRYIACDRSDTNVLGQNKYICILDVGNMGNIQTIGARTSAATNPLYANITDWTWNDDRVLFGWKPSGPGNKCKLMSCSVTGGMNVVNFLYDPANQMHVFSPSVIFDPIARKERLLFLTSRAPGSDPADPSSTVDVWTVTYDPGSVPNWADKVPLTAFITNSRFQSVRWCPELNTNYQPILKRCAIVKTKAAGLGREIIVFNNVRDIIYYGAPLVTNLMHESRLNWRENNASGGSQVSWTYDGIYLMYSKYVGQTSEFYTARSWSTNWPTRFIVPSVFDNQNKEWLCINPAGTRLAFTVNNQIYILPMAFSNAAITNAGTTNIISDGGYTRVLIPSDALQSNVSFSITEPNVIDTNQFSGAYMGSAREFSADGWTNQYDFTTNVEMYLQYSSSDLPTDVAPTNLSIYLYNSTNIGAGGTTGTWSKLPSMVDTNDEYVISTNITHFSTYAIGNGLSPAAPTNVGASQGTYTDKVTITWSASAGANGYVVWTNSVSVTSSAAIAVSGVSTTRWDDTNGGISATTYYWVQATNDDGAGDWSSPASGWRSANSSVSVLGTNGATITNGEAASAAKGTDLGSISWGIAVTNTLSITNSGTVSLSINGLTTNGAGAGHFRAVGVPSIVSVAAVSNFSVIFAPAAGGAHTAAVIIANNSTNAPSYVVYLAGTGLKHDQTITNFPNPGTQMATNTARLYAQASSDLQVSNFTVASGPAVISGLTNMTFTNSGSITVLAGQAGNASWNAASNVTNTFTVNKASQTITFPAIADQVTTSTVSLTATANSTLPVSFSVASGPGTISGGATLALTGAGSVSIIASQTGNAIWNPAPNVTNTFTVSKANQAITFPAIADQLVTASLTLSATAGSGLVVSFAVGNGPASISGGTSLSFSDTGRVSIVASQSGNAIWNTAANVTNSFNVTAVVVTNLGVPQNVTATDGTLTGRVVVTWSAVTGANGYEIWNSDVNNIGTASSLGRSTATIYNDTSAGARAGLMKYYWLRAWNTATTGAFSAVDSGYALPDAGFEITSGQPAIGDFDGDGKADPTVYHLNSGRLYVWASSGYYSLLEPAIQFHVESGEVPAFGDYDGDNYMDGGVFRAIAGTWYVWLSSAGYYRVGPVLFGLDANDIPVAADYDGDAKTDPAVYHGVEGAWYVWLSSAGYYRVGPLTQFYVGSADIPVPGDYDGDGKADPAVYQSVAGTWSLWLSASGYAQLGPVTFATSDAHLAVPADYDGDNKCDPAAYIPTLGKWRMWMSGSAYGLTEMELR